MNLLQGMEQCAGDSGDTYCPPAECQALCSFNFPDSPTGQLLLLPFYRCCNRDSDKENWEEVELRGKGRSAATPECVCP